MPHSKVLKNDQDKDETLERKSNYQPTSDPFLDEIENFNKNKLRKASDRKLKDVQPSENSGNDMASILRRAMQKRRNSMEGHSKKVYIDDTYNSSVWDDEPENEVRARD